MEKDYTHCPQCGVEPWNGSDGAAGVCPACQAAGPVAVLDGPDPDPEPERNPYTDPEDE